MQERRKRPRLRVLKSAKPVLGKSSVFDCVVRDLTNVGAGIEIPDAIDLPEILEMTFDGGRSIRPCRLVWRTLSRSGVEFL
jgi:PilZ domain